MEWRETRNRSLQALSFPFDTYRAGQRELAAAVYKTIHAQQKLFVEAPTGTERRCLQFFQHLKQWGKD